MDERQLSQAAAGLATVVLGAVTVFQLMLACGAPWGRLAWGGQHERLPRHLRLASLASFVLLIWGAICVLERAELINLVGWTMIVKVTVWMLTALFTLSILGNLLSSSPWEKRIGTPLALLLSGTCLIVALGI